MSGRIELIIDDEGDIEQSVSISGLEDAYKMLGIIDACKAEIVQDLLIARQRDNTSSPN